MFPRIPYTPSRYRHFAPFIALAIGVVLLLAGWWQGDRGMFVMGVVVCAGGLLSAFANRVVREAARGSNGDDHSQD